MKKSNRFFAGAICFFSALTFSCNNISDISMPKSVSISTGAEYSLCLGSMEFDLSSVFGKDSFLTELRASLGNSVDLYEYEQANSDVLAYVAHFPLYEFPFDVGSYFNGIGFDTIFDSVKDKIAIDKTIKIDESMTHFSGTKIQPVDIESCLENDKIAAEYNVEVPETNANLQEILSNINFDKLEVESIAEYTIYSEDSSIDFVVTPSDDINSRNPDYSLSAEIKVVKKDDLESVFSTSGVVDITTGGTVSVKIGKDVISEGLPAEYSVILDANSTGSNLTTIHEYTFSLGLNENSKIEKVINIDASSLEDIAYDIDPISVDFSSAADYFSKAAIKDGEISFEALIPDGWEDITATPTITISGAGLSYDENDFTDNSSVSGNFLDEYLDLAGGNLDFTSEPALNVAISVKFDVDGATIDFTKSTEQQVEINYNAQISKLGDLEIDITKLGVEANNDFTQPGAITADALSFIKTITFGVDKNLDGKYYKHTDKDTVGDTVGNGLGFKCKVYNNLDLQDDLEISIKSDILNYNHTATISGDMSTEETQNWVSYNTIDFTEKSGDQDLDFAVTLPTKISVDEFEIGKDYAIRLSMEEMFFDYDTVTVDMSNKPKQGNVEMQIFAVTSILTNFLGEDADNVQIQSLPIFFYAQKPDETVSPELASLLNGVGLTGTINSVSTKNEITNTVALRSGDIPFIDLITWPSSDTSVIKSGDEFAQKYLTKAADPEYYSFDTDIADSINAEPDALSFEYNLSLTGGDGDLVICKEIIDGIEASDSINIKMDMAVIFALSLNLKDNISIDVMSSVYGEDEDSENKDLLARSDADSWSDFVEYVDSIKYLKFQYAFENKIIKGLDISASMSDEKTGINNTLTLKTSGSNSFEISGDDLKTIFNTYPFHPQVMINIAGGPENGDLPYDAETNPYKTFSIRRSAMEEGNAKFGITPKVNLKFNKNKPINFEFDSMSMFGWGSTGEN